jgi:radical SAM protein with 4Fe4S-binding SPASM domain
MPYCSLPWTNLDISPQGKMSPCCKFESHLYPYKPENINTSTIDEYINSPIVKEVKQDFKNDKWPKGCQRCKIEEDSGIVSKRVQDHARWGELFSEDRGFVTASISFGNTCNLSCITCDPSASSRWQQEAKILLNRDVKPNHFYKEGFVDSFKEKTPNLVHLDIPGGEPLLSGVKQQKELLYLYVEDDLARNITLHYTTNCTQFPDDEWLSLWSHFKEVELQLSIDGIGDKFEYIRYPAVWEQVVPNIKKYLELRDKGLIKLSVSTTVSAYNIAYLDELLQWLDEMSLGMPYLGRVHTPTYMRPTVWKKDARDYIIDRLKNSRFDLDSFITLMQTEDDSKNFENFRYRLLRHDSYRKLNFRSTFKEMAAFLIQN